MGKHTGGDWQAVAGIGRWNVTTVSKPRTFNICSVNTDRAEQEANAHLIAAAPDLLVHAKHLIDMLCGDSISEWRTQAVDDLIAAIAKAEGRTP